MRASIIIQAPHPLAGFGPKRSPLNPAALVVVLLLSALCAGAILAALQPAAPVDAFQASVQGGL